MSALVEHAPLTREPTRLDEEPLAPRPYVDPQAAAWRHEPRQSRVGPRSATPRSAEGLAGNVELSDAGSVRDAGAESRAANAASSKPPSQATEPQNAAGLSTRAGGAASKPSAHAEQLRQTHAASIWLDRAGIFARRGPDASERDRRTDGASAAAECAPPPPVGAPPVAEGAVATDEEMALWLARAEDARWLATAGADELRAAATSLARGYAHERRRRGADGERGGAAASGPAKMRLALEVLRSELEHARKTVRALKAERFNFEAMTTRRIELLQTQLTAHRADAARAFADLGGAMAGATTAAAVATALRTARAEADASAQALALELAAMEGRSAQEVRARMEALEDSLLILAATVPMRAVLDRSARLQCQGARDREPPTT